MGYIMAYILEKENGTYEIDIQLRMNEYDYPKAYIRVKGLSNEFEDLEIVREYQEDIIAEKILEKLKDCIYGLEERFKKYKCTMDLIDTMINSGSI